MWGTGVAGSGSGSGSGVKVEVLKSWTVRSFVRLGRPMLDLESVGQCGGRWIDKS